MRVAAVAVLLLVPPSFRGCGSSAGDDDPVPLPTVDAGAGCVLDSDCMADECSDVRCVSGTCIEVAPTRDADLDGIAPPPCGMDCDDRSAAVFPGAGEQCDALDNDCDGTVDEDAPPGAIRNELDGTVADRTSMVLPWSVGFVVTRTETRAVVGSLVLSEGTTTDSFTAVTTTADTFTVHAGAGAPDGRLLIAAGTEAGDVRWSIHVPGAVGGAVLVESGSFAASGRITAMAAAWHVDGWVLALDTVESGGGFERNLTFLPAAAPVLVPVASGGSAPDSLGVASDGARIAVSEADAISFFADTGGRIARHRALGPLGRTPIASWEGDVMVTWSDAFDWNLGHQRSMVPMPDSIQAAPRIGTSTLSDIVEIHRADDQLVLTRTSRGGVAAFVLRARDFAPIRSFTEDMIGGTFGELPARVTVAAGGGGVGILTAFDGGASLAVLGCSGGA